MFKIGDRVKHKTTGIVGKIIGYGSRQIAHNHLITIQVELDDYCPAGSIKPIAEDILARWQRTVRDKKILACTLPYPKHYHSK